jgi:ankyrin repeat protein
LGKALAEAARDGDAVAVRRLLDEGAMPDSGFASGYTALGLACNRGHAAVAEKLLMRGASANLPICSEGTTPLVISVVWKRRAAVDLLLRHGAAIVPSSQR